MNKPDDILKGVLALHFPEAKNNQMVHQVWEDGEITLTKGADLFGHRSLHMQLPGNNFVSLAFDVLPYKTESHSSIICESWDSAMMARNLIFSLE